MTVRDKYNGAGSANTLLSNVNATIADNDVHNFSILEISPIENIIADLFLIISLSIFFSSIRKRNVFLRYGFHYVYVTERYYCKKFVMNYGETTRWFYQIDASLSKIRNIFLLNDPFRGMKSSSPVYAPIV